MIVHRLVFSSAHGTMWGLHVHVSGAQEAGWTLMMKGKHDPFLEQIAGVTGTPVDA